MLGKEVSESGCDPLLVQSDSGVCSDSPKTTHQGTAGTRVPDVLFSLPYTAHCPDLWGKFILGSLWNGLECLPKGKHSPFPVLHCSLLRSLCASTNEYGSLCAPLIMPIPLPGELEMLVKPNTGCLDLHPGRSWFRSLAQTPQVPKLSDPSSEPKQSSSSGRQADKPWLRLLSEAETAPGLNDKGLNSILPGL